jgi:hypothetical protein
LYFDFRKQADSVCSGGHSTSGSGSPEMFTRPSSDMQLIIDKMASYVAKNGRDFEAIVRSKGKEEVCIFLKRHICHNVRLQTLIPIPILLNESSEHFIPHKACAAPGFFNARVMWLNISFE